MSTNGIRVDEFNIFALGGEAVSYHLKDIHTIALQVTDENIGGLSLELSEELRYLNGDTPFLGLRLARGTKEEPEEDRTVCVKPGDWLVILWDEIHVFKDPQFRSTFSFDGLSAPGAMDHMRDYAERDVAASAHIGGIRQGESLTEYVERNQNQEDPNWQPEVSPALPEETQLPMEDVWAENDEELTQQTTIVPAVGELEDKQDGGNTRPVGE